MVIKKTLLSTDSLDTDHETMCNVPVQNTDMLRNFDTLHNTENKHSDTVQEQVLQFSPNISLNINKQENFSDLQHQYILQNETEPDLQSILDNSFEIHR